MASAGRTSAPVEPVLDADEIQGNSVPGFLKPFMAVVVLRIDDAPKARAWCAEMAGRVTTLAEAMESRVKVRAHRGFTADVRLRTLGEVPEEVDDAFTNVGFSASALAKLLAGPYAADLALFTDEAFQAGMPARSALLGDPTDPSAEGNVANWKVGAEGADVMVVVGADREEECAREVTEVRESAVAGGMTVVYEEPGRKLNPLAAEHFGFQDSLSQPGVRGRLSDDPESFVTPRFIDPGATPDAWLYGMPGQYLLWPGEFVFGYAKSSADPLVPGAENLPGPAWARNGSYVAFRRLRQDVAAFWQFATTYASGLGRRPGFEGVTPEWVGSRIIGRWKSGAPVSRVPDGDDMDLGVDRLANNNFGYATKSGTVPLAGGGTSNHWPEAGPDPVGLTCPLAAHIRKVNPRETPNDLGGRRAAFTRRILRRALPFGPPLEDPLGPDPANGQRGLLFLSYQASITDQFEFLCTSWMGSATNPRSPSGFDMVVGQNGNPGSDRSKTCVVFGTDASQATLYTPTDFVIPTGGGYFFSPSVSALRDVLGGSG